jgi:hypothetical protein
MLLPRDVSEDNPDMKPLEAPIIVERNFLVDGKKVTVHVTFPAKLGREIGLENTYACAQGVLVKMESSKAKVKDLKSGQ